MLSVSAALRAGLALPVGLALGSGPGVLAGHPCGSHCAEGAVPAGCPPPEGSPRLGQAGALQGATTRGQDRKRRDQGAAAVAVREGCAEEAAGQPG